MEAIMNKIIVVETCRTCPYLGYQKRTKKYICSALSIDVTRAVKQNVIAERCLLDDALIEKKYFNSPDIVNSEGEAICKSIPQNEGSDNHYLIGETYNFQRQIDGNLRVYLYGIESAKYLLYPPKVFETHFKVQGEQSLNVDANEVCSECGRPKRWCECL